MTTSSFSKNIRSKVLLHALHYTVFDYSNTEGNEKIFRSNEKKTKKERCVCDNLPGYTLLSLSMNAVDSELTVGRE